MSNWPEPTPEPGERPRWLGWALLAGTTAGLVIWTSSDGPARSWRLPEFSLPEFSLPEISLSDLGNDEPAPNSPAQPANSDARMRPTFELDVDDPSAVVQEATFDACMQSIENATAGFGAPILLDDTSDRRIAVFKFADGDFTVTCSRPDGTMRVLRRD